ncbi:beta strand repeat-containing protein [Tabrizicola sp.]|uniref:beta strand repeat-containing protein n=1 Tax=Tabrizicola sp. TaxID=2005166 RepID=UPI003D2E239E
MATINGGSGHDTLTGLAEADIITGNAGNDSISGLGGADTLFGGDGNDQLFGGLGDDLLEGGAGNDLMEGGDGIDTLSYQNSTAGVFVSLSSGTAEGGHAVGDTFSGIENLRGSAFGDTLVGDGMSNTIWGLAGNDRLDGRAGGDTMHGGLGNDVFVVDDAADVVIELLNEGIDTVESWVHYTLADNVENLVLFGTTNINGTGNAGNNVIEGNASTLAFGGDNILQGLAGNDTLYGYNGFDTLDGGTGNDVMYGGSGDDLFIVDSAADQVIELVDGGNDTVASSISYILYEPVTSNHIENITLTGTAHLTATGNSLRNTLVGNAGNNILTGGGGNDTLRGEDGNDTLDGGTGNDSMVGGAGDDLFYVDSAQDRVSEALNGGIDTVWSSVNGLALASNVENLNLAIGIVSGSGNNLNNILTGNAVDNLLSGETGNDTLYGGAGNDTLDGGTGADFMQGGAGDDVYRVDHIGDVANESDLGAGGIDLVETRVSHVLGFGIENLLVIGSADTVVTGNTLNNTMTGGTGDDLINGMEGNDTLTGGEGKDTLIGGAGVDLFYGGAGNDVYVIDAATETIVELAGGGIDTVQIAASYTLALELENLTLLGTSNISGTGNAAANIITGNGGNNNLSGSAGNDSLFGGAGNDRLNGGTGIDLMEGGTGNDTYVVDHANDKVLERASTGGVDLVESSVSYVLGSNLENLTLTGSAHINGTGNSLANVLTANAGNNRLFGSGGNDVLSGLAGNDTLDGGSGNDTMIGGLGNDTYYLSSIHDVMTELASEGIDTVISDISHSLAANFENLVLAGTSGTTATGNQVDNILTGNGGANRLNGLEGNDTLNGGAGGDTLDGGAGNDVMVGGTGNDVYIIDSLGDVVTELALGGIDRIQTGFSTILGAHIENLVLTGSADLNGTGNAEANQITGNSGDNLLAGHEGNDTLNGGAGADTLNGGAGRDSMIGGLGDDVYYVDTRLDIIIEGATGGTDLVYTLDNYRMARGVENLIMQGSADLTATGNTAANTMTGNAGDNLLLGGSGADTLYGGGGADTLNGGTGNDSMIGGAGNDTYYVGSLADRIVETANGGIDTALVSTNHVMAANVENVTMLSSGAYRVTGNDLDNVILGNRGQNTINGGAGDDTINGGAGNDVLTGGEGADHFVFSGTSFGLDRITDFNTLDGGPGEGDRLVFEGLLVGGFVYRGDAAFTGGSNNSEARFDNDTRRLQIDFDGDGVTNFSITLTGMTSDTQLTAGHFIWS